MPCTVRFTFRLGHGIWNRRLRAPDDRAWDGRRSRPVDPRARSSALQSARGRRGLVEGRPPIARLPRAPLHSADRAGPSSERPISEILFFGEHSRAARRRARHAPHHRVHVRMSSVVIEPPPLGSGTVEPWTPATSMQPRSAVDELIPLLERARPLGLGSEKTPWREALHVRSSRRAARHSTKGARSYVGQGAGRLKQ